MRRKVLIAALALIGLGVFSGTTVFREGIAQAAQAVTAEIVGPLDAQGNVKVHEQGTADVKVTNRAVPVVGTVDLDVTTTKLLGTPPGGLHVGPLDVEIGTVDTASFSQVRVAADLRDPGPLCELVFLHVFMTDASGSARDLLKADLCGNSPVTRVLDIPGTALQFLVSNSSGSDVTADVAVWGR
jgi:hypothetical protein